ncbi:type I restriction endonuclease subunit R [Rhodanobacter sp. FDAARGOS 1247]|uniref:type I restriction endonuclease subunit R n=1 Tax=Rhodanobacter sp. FDAARGOS 1247 TaxID=2778082 RepID=UPI0019501009|nr:type I restriction endonuclease subunit R [Rhodanobacter sp. FDAARGOS 1247]QRP64186.1 type I restriction endonuclease subunit R [Rhodanobacter sp. FDAARGOS 1247]
MKEDHLESACLDWLGELSWTCVHGDEVSPGGDQCDRARYSDVVLASRLREATVRLNPELTAAEVDEVVDKLTGYGAQSLVDGNKEVYDWLRNGVPIQRIEPDGRRTVLRARVIDVDGGNDLLAVQQLTVHGLKVRRPDLVLFVNGLPLVVIELKNPADLHADIEAAWNQIQTYQTDIPQLFYFNLLNVISDGTVARYGSLTAEFGRYSRWRLLGGERVAKGRLELDVLMLGLFEPRTLLTFFHSFVAFGGADGGASFKIIAQWHQYHGVQKAVARAADALLHRKDGKGGVIWFTQGSGKSLLALFYVMALRDHPEFRNPTVVLVTDRNDLDGQLYETFSDCAWSLRGTPEQADSRDDLRDKLSQVQAGGIIFTTINKFAPEAGKASVPVLCDRSNVIVIADEAHRTQYGFRADMDVQTGKTKYGLAKYMRDALPNAIYLGMTGTPVSLDDRDTEAVFGSYVDVYDMIAAQDDHAVVPVSYESRIIELRFNEAEKQALMDEFLEVTEDEDEGQQSKTASRLTRLEALAMAEGRLEVLAADLVAHWEARTESVAGKAMIVAISREAAIRLYDAIVKLRPDWHSDDINAGHIKIVMTGSSADPSHYQPHRTDKPQRKLLEKRFKDPADPLELVIVRDMWLTGFDAPPVHTLYVDKPMQGHGLMQAIARTNRIWKDKPGGLIVDYIGIGEELKKAIRQYTKDAGAEREPVDTSGAALQVLLDTLDVIRKEFFHGFDYAGIEQPKKALALLGPAMEHILQVNPEVDGKGRNLGVRSYLDQVAKLTTAQALAGTQPKAMAVREEIAFIQAVRVCLIKLTRAGEGRSRLEKEAALRQLVAKGVLVDGVNDIFATLGLGKADISLLDEEFLKQIREMPTKNLAAELLERLLADQIRSRGQKNAMQGKEFTKKLEEAITKYQNRGLTTVEVIEEMIKLAQEINAARPPDGMSEEEFAFYQALIENESAVRELGHPVLRALAMELTDKLRRSATINWQNRRDSRARMMAMIKVLLAKHKYPPDKQREATEKVIAQAELLADAWAGDASPA